MFLELASKIIPNRLKFAIKPYFRYVFPNKIMATISITFRCNYKCSYCPYCGAADFSKKFPLNCEKTGKQWVDALEKLPPTSFNIVGGEPFIYKDFDYLINNMPNKHSILCVTTNASLPIETYKKIKKRIHLNISYHREFIKDNDKFLEKVLLLKDLFHISVNIVATPENYDFIKYNLKKFKEYKIPYHIDPLIINASKHYDYNDDYKALLKRHMGFDRIAFQKYDSNLKKRCSAGRNYYNITPDGDVYTCLRAIDYWNSPLIENKKDKKYKLGNIFTDNIVLNKTDIICDYECLNHCDWDYAKISLLK